MQGTIFRQVNHFIEHVALDVGRNLFIETHVRTKLFYKIHFSILYNMCIHLAALPFPYKMRKCLFRERIRLIGSLKNCPILNLTFKVLRTETEIVL